jgi:extracellular factor (EF) 3-hydroxypalmitic acid methyl ester biosynthesis protein
MSEVQETIDFLFSLEPHGPRENQFAAVNLSFAALDRLGIRSSAFTSQLENTSFSDIRSMHGHATLCPYGYHGDFEIIDRIYNCYISDAYPSWDLYFQSGAASHAVRGRKKYFIQKMIDLSSYFSKPKVLNLASGPARDLAELLEVCHDFDFDCVDADTNALTFAKSLVLQQNIRFICKNAFNFRPDKKYDVVWCAGLFDYLSDKAALLLMKKISNWMHSDSVFIFGNFNNENSQKSYMEFGGWSLIHRSDESLLQLASQIFPTRSIMIEREETNVNSFCCVA